MSCGRCAASSVHSHYSPHRTPYVHTHLQVRLELEALRSQQCSFEVDLARPDKAVQRASGSKTVQGKAVQGKAVQGKAVHDKAVQGKAVQAKAVHAKSVQDGGDPQQRHSRSRVPGSPWSRDEALPSWNKCFLCVFNKCGTYRGPAKAPDVSEMCRNCESVNCRSSLATAARTAVLPRPLCVPVVCGQRGDASGHSPISANYTTERSC